MENILNLFIGIPIVATIWNVLFVLLKIYIVYIIVEALDKLGMLPKIKRIHGLSFGLDYHKEGITSSQWINSILLSIIIGFAFGVFLLELIITISRF